jgi:uncharacterized membrane protein YoaT (DUF817 family)
MEREVKRMPVLVTLVIIDVAIVFACLVGGAFAVASASDTGRRSTIVFLTTMSTLLILVDVALVSTSGLR